MTTNKTKTIAIRVPTDVYWKVKYFADKRGVAVSQWLKPIIIRAINAGKKSRR